VIEASLIRVGGIYEGIKGQQRKITQIEGEQITFEIVNEGELHQLPLASVHIRPLKGFCEWAAKAVDLP
jgi:hypothetical protein